MLVKSCVLIDVSSPVYHPYASPSETSRRNNTWIRPTALINEGVRQQRVNLHLSPFYLTPITSI